MSRAVRRQQGSQQDGAGGGDRRGGGSRTRLFGSREPRPTRGNRPTQTRRRRIGAPAWATEIWSELRKVTWPTRDETAYLTMVVIIVAVAVGVMLGAVDAFFNWLIDRILLS
jgi:preprotein translocase subunit SecE